MNATIAVTKPVVKEVKLDGGEVFKIKLWDCGGQERFTNISKAFLKDAVGCIIIFSLDSSESLKKAKIWIDSVNRMRQEDGKSVQIILAANKVDLPADQIEFSNWEEEGKKLAKDCCIDGADIPFCKTSAKQNVGIEEMFKMMAEMIKKANSKMVAPAPAPTPGGDGKGCCLVM